MLEITTHYRRRSWEPRRLSKKSLVIPDQTISLKTMVTKYVRGLPIEAPNFNGIGTEDEVATDFKKLDLAEQEEIILRAQDELKMFDDAKTRLEQEKAAKEKEKAENERKELEELRKLKVSQTSNNLT